MLAVCGSSLTTAGFIFWLLAYLGLSGQIRALQVCHMPCITVIICLILPSTTDTILRSRHLCFRCLLIAIGWREAGITAIDLTY